MNVYLLFVIIIIGWFVFISLRMKKSKRVEKHFLKLLWGFYIVAIISMYVSIEMVEDVTTASNKKLLAIKKIQGDTIQMIHREKNGINALLEIGDEEFYTFRTLDGMRYQIEVSSVIEEQIERPEKVIIYQADIYTGYRCFYLFKAKGRYLYKFE